MGLGGARQRYAMSLTLNCSTIICISDRPVIYFIPSADVQKAQNIAQRHNQFFRGGAWLFFPVDRLACRLSIPQLADIFRESGLDILHFTVGNMIGDNIESRADGGDWIVFRIIVERRHHGVHKLVLVPDIGGIF